MTERDNRVDSRGACLSCSQSAFNPWHFIWSPSTGMILELSAEPRVMPEHHWVSPQKMFYK